MRAPFLPAIHTARLLSLSLLVLVSLPSYARHIPHPPLHFALLPMHPFLLVDAHPLHTLVSSFSNFPRWRYRPLCSFLDTAERLNATTSSLRFFLLPLFFLSFFVSFLFPSQGLIRSNGVIRRSGGKKNRSPAFVESFVESPDTYELYSWIRVLEVNEMSTLVS